MPNLDRYPCPCCGRLVHQQMPGFHQRCPVCGWEDDLAQLRFPLMPGSSNAVSLREAQQHVQAYGASERRRLGSTRSAVDGEEVNLGWRPLDIERDNALHRVPVFRWGFRALAELAKRTMNRTQTLELLSQHKAHFARLYGVTGLVLFGFTVRGEAREDSDIDILVGFDGPATSERYFGVQF